MKKLFKMLLGFSSLLLFTIMMGHSYQAQSQAIGVVQHGTPKFTVDVQNLINTFEKNLKNASGIDAQFAAVNIIAVGANYVLIFNGPIYASKFAVNTSGIDKNGNAILVANGTITCTTSECSSQPDGCVPLTTYCSECTNKGKCTKTMSEISMLQTW